MLTALRGSGLKLRCFTIMMQPKATVQKLHGGSRNDISWWEKKKKKEMKEERKKKKKEYLTKINIVKT